MSNRKEQPTGPHLPADFILIVWTTQWVAVGTQGGSKSGVYKLISILPERQANPFHRWERFAVWKVVRKCKATEYRLAGFTDRVHTAYLESESEREASTRPGRVFNSNSGASFG